MGGGVSKKIDMKTIYKSMSCTHAPQPRQVDARIPFVGRGFAACYLK